MADVGGDDELYKTTFHEGADSYRALEMTVYYYFRLLGYSYLIANIHVKNKE